MMAPSNSSCKLAMAQARLDHKLACDQARKPGPEDICQKRKRGPVQAPFFIIDAPKPVTESRIGSGHPGKPIFVSCQKKCKSVARWLMPMENLWR